MDTFTAEFEADSVEKSVPAVVEGAGEVAEEGVGVGDGYLCRLPANAIQRLRDLIPSGREYIDLVAIPEGETAASILSALRNGDQVGETYLRVSTWPLSGPYAHSWSLLSCRAGTSGYLD